jgi:hypothetical protein
MLIVVPIPKLHATEEYGGMEVELHLFLTSGLD